MKTEANETLASWLTDAPNLFGREYSTLRKALVERDADTVARILQDHGQLERLVPILDEIELLERAAAHDELAVVRTLDAEALVKHWHLTPEGLAAVDEFA